MSTETAILSLSSIFITALLAESTLFPNTSLFPQLTINRLPYSKPWIMLATAFFIGKKLTSVAINMLRKKNTINEVGSSPQDVEADLAELFTEVNEILYYL